MKLILKIILIPFALLFCLAIFFLFKKPPAAGKNEPEPIVSITTGDHFFNIAIRRKEKEFSKTILKKIKTAFYLKAEENNPSGDLIPDELDDRLLDKIKAVF